MRPLSRQNLKPASISMHVFHCWCQLAAMCHSREEQHKGHSVRLAALRSLGCGNKQGSESPDQTLCQCPFATFPTCRHTFQPSPIQIKPFICEIPHFLKLLLLWSSRITTGINRVLRCLSQADHGTSCPALQLMTTRNINCLHLYLDTSEVTQLPKCRAPDSLFALVGLLTQLKCTAAHQFESLVGTSLAVQLQFLQDPTKHRKDFNAQAAQHSVVKLTFIKHRNAEFHYS